MSLDWETFRAASGLSDTILMHVDEEGTEVSIGSECEFQEALRIARANKNCLKLIIYDNNKTQNGRRNRMGLFQPPQPIPTSSKKLQEGLKKCNANTLTNCSSKDNSCCCHGDAPPEWFLHYMEKFEKEFLYELKSHIHGVIHSALDKEKKLSDPEMVEKTVRKTLLGLSGSSQSKKKKKSSERDLTDLTDQRDMKLPKKLEKPHATKSERLEKLDNKTRVLLEEKRRLLERKRHSKSKSDKNSSTTTDKKSLLKKSAFFQQNDVYLFLPPGSKFQVTLNIVNDGKVRWTAPRLQCYEFRGLSLKEETITLPRLLPTESCFATLRGQVSQRQGINYVKCKVVDGLELFGPEFTCWAKVELSESPRSDLVSPNKTDDDPSELRDTEGTLIDFDKDVISNSQKKIEENISEIEKRLRDIDLLRPSVCVDANSKSKNFGKKSNKKGEELESGCDLILNFEEKEKSWKDRLAQENLLFGSDVTSKDDHAVGMERQIDNDKENNKNSDDGELESSSDSDMSLVFMLEEEDNFIMVPSKSPSLAESANESKSLPNDEPKDKIPKSSDQIGTGAIKRQFTKPDAKQEVQEQKEEVETFQSSPTRSRRSPFGEEISKPKKMKSKSSEYRFTTANLTQPQPLLNFTQILEEFLENKPSKFTVPGEKEGQQSQTPEGVFERRRSRFTVAGEKEGQQSQTPEGVFEGRRSRFTVAGEKEGQQSQIPEGVFEGRHSRFTFTGEKEEKQSQTPEGVFEGRPSRFTFTGEKEGSSKDEVKNTNVPKTDADGKVIYAVDSRGFCLPVRNLPNGEQRPGPESSKSEQRRNERPNDIPAVNILPNALMNGASNVASLAFNTAKSVISNLQSAFVTEGKTEFGQPACEAVSMKAMCNLYDMGFSNVQVNRKLLLKHNNDIVKVIEELVRMQDDSSENQHQ